MSGAPAKINPFPGLRPFTQEEDYLFFGREDQTMELLQLLGKERFVAVVGTSGSGKSSLVRCGLLSELLGGKLKKAGASWEVAVTHPGGDPLALLAEAILEADLYDRNLEHARENLLATLSRSHFGLIEAIKQARLGEDVNFLLVVDQFEEIFRFNEAGQVQQEAANEFVSLLLESAAQTAVPIYIVITMRSDFIGECGQFEGLAEMVNRGEFLIPRLSREQYKRVIEAPIKVAGGQITPRLLQRLLNDLGQQADQLPCLQHALLRTWDVWAARGDALALDLDDYQRVGRMSEALSLHADEIYSSLANDRQRELCAGMFKALTMQESESRGIRRPQRLGSLCRILDVSAGELLPIIHAYRQHGVTFLTPSQEVELTERTIIDISHESLMRVWTRLRNWVEEEAQAAGIYLRLSESAALYKQGKSGLYRDPELGIALAWQESERPNAAWAERYRVGFDAAMAFLEASRQASALEEEAREAARQRELDQARQLAEAQRLRLDQQQRAARRLRLMIAGLAAVALLACVACAAALFANQRAITLAVTARQNEEKARQNEQQAKDYAQRAEQSQKETASALAVVESQKAKAETAERLARTAEEAGRKLLYTTDMRLAPFVWKDDRTTAEQLRVLLAKHIPSERMKDEGGRMNGEKTAADGANSSFSLRPSSFDLRGFEWYYYQHLLEHSATVFSGHAVTVVGGALTADGQAVTLDQNGQLRRWDLGSQAEDPAGRRDLPGGPGAQLRVLSPNGRLAALAEGNKVHVFETSTGNETFQIDSSHNQPRRLIFSRDGDRLVIVDDKIRWLSARSGEVFASLDQKFYALESLALSADGLTLAVVGRGPGGAPTSIFRLDAAAKKVTLLAQGFGLLNQALYACALTPDGGRITVGAKFGGAVAVCDTATGRSIAQHGAAHASPITAMVFSSDGAWLATADIEGTIKIWADPGKLDSKSTALLTLKGHQGAVSAVAFSSDGKRLLTTSADKTARVWDLENAGAAIRPLEGGSNNRTCVTRFSPDGQLIAAANGRSVRLWDAATGRLVRELPAVEKGYISSVAFSPTDRRLLAVGCGFEANVSYVALWDIDAGSELARLPGATDLPNFQVGEAIRPVGALAFSPDGKYLVAGFGSKFLLAGGGLPTPLKVWEVATRRLIRRLNGHTYVCASLDFSRDGTLLASGSYDGTAIIWSTKTWTAMHTLQIPEKESLYGGRGTVDDVAFSPDGKTLALASSEKSVELWDVATGKLLETLKGHSSAVDSVVFSPDGRTLVSGGEDETVRLWNVETRRQLMQLDAGGVELGFVLSLALSPDGQHLLAGGHRGAAFWSSTPIVWNDPERAAEQLRLLLKSNADFRSRIRMLSENLRLHEALAKVVEGGGWRVQGKTPSSDHPPPSTPHPPPDWRVQAALAATQANWHASRKAWPEAVAAFDRLVAADPAGPKAWLRTPGLLRLATALLHQNRPAIAATLLEGGAKRRSQDGLPAVVDTVGAGFETLARYVNDPATREQLYPLRSAVEERLAKEPRNAGLLELRAELAGQWSDARAQVADYTAAIESLAEHKNPEVAAVDIKRLYARRGNAHLALREWQKAIDDYARVVTDATIDEELLTNQAAALAELILAPARWTVLKPVRAKSELGATFSILPDDSILASGAHRWKDRYHVELTLGTDINLMAVRLEALTHDSLPNHGPGRHTTGSFAQISWNVTAAPPSGKEPITLKFDNAWADHQLAGYPIDKNGHWNIYGGQGGNCTAVWSMSKPVSLPAGTTLTFEMQCQTGSDDAENIGHFRLSVSSDPAALEHEREYLAATKLTDPWQELAAAYQIEGNQRAIDQLVERRPKLAGPIGDLFTHEPKPDWQRAIEIYTKGVTATKDEGGRMKDEKKTELAPPDSSLIPHPSSLSARRARAHEALKNWDAAAADWSRAASVSPFAPRKDATGNPNGPRLLAEFARRLAAADQLPLAKAQFDQSEALYARSLREDPENDLIAAELAQLLFDKEENENPTRWAILKPSEMKSKGGATLSKLPDESVLASGKNPLGDAYTIVAPTQVTQVSAIRLEALTHESLPNQGPGRDDKGDRGNFAMVNFTITAHVPGTQPRPIEVSRVAGDHDFRELTTNHWNIAGGVSRPHTAFYLAKQPVDCKDGTRLEFQLEFSDSADWPLQNLGRFRLSVASDPAAFDLEQTRFAAMTLMDPWAKLAVAYGVNGRNDEATRYFTRFEEKLAKEPENTALAADLLLVYQSAGRTREAIPFLTKASAANPNQTLVSLKVAAFQAWFGQEKELAATRQRIRTFAQGTRDAATAEQAAKACSIVPSTDKAELDAALALARKGVELQKGEGGREWRLLALGMAEYRSGDDAAAALALFAAAQADPNDPRVTGTSGLYRAMSLFRQGKKDEARKLAIEAAARMKPLPKDEQNPLPDAAHPWDDLILWLAYKEAKALIGFDAPLAAPVRTKAR